jgi:hypothetical protein
MKIFLGLSAATLTILLAGCSPAPSSGPETCPAAPVTDAMSPSPDDVAESSLKFAQQLVGFSEKTAESCVTGAGLVWRVVGRDGESFVVTQDYNPLRVNVVIEISEVTEVRIG